MTTVRVYDLPTRLFHWSFAALFVGAYATANLVDDESARFAWHMLAGLLLGVAVLLRLVWGFIGTRHARWSDLQLHPRQLSRYAKSVVAGGGDRWTGHNPGSSWAALLMLLLAAGLVGTGLAMATGVAGESVADVHELIANAFLAVVLLHLAGLAVHVLRHRDRLPRSMLTGRKQLAAGNVAGVPARSGVAMAMALVLLVAGGLLVAGYRPASRTLQLFGAQLVLGEDGEDAGAPHGARGDANLEADNETDDDD